MYAAGGYYYPSGSGHSLRDELRAYQDQGYTPFKIKIGGPPPAPDPARLEGGPGGGGGGRAHPGGGGNRRSRTPPRPAGGHCTRRQPRLHAGPRHGPLP